MAQDADPIMGGLFGCHEFNKRPSEEHRPCGGWLLDQKRRGVPSIRLRLSLSMNEQAAKCFEEANENGLELFSSIAEMVTENMKRMNKPVVPREYEIFKHTGQSGMYKAPTSLIVPAVTKREAIAVARARLGPGTYEAFESSPQLRAEHAKWVADIERKLGQQKEPALVVNAEGGLQAEDE